MEIITGVERRRRCRPEEKLRILAEHDEPGAKFNDVSRRHDVSRGLLWQQREARGRGRLAEDVPASDAARSTRTASAPRPRYQPDRLQLELPTELSPPHLHPPIS